MTAGEGGLIVTDDAQLAERAWSLRNVGRVRGGEWYGHETIGWNLRMTEFQAALLLPWLDRLDAEIDRREEFASALRRHLTATLATRSHSSRIRRERPAPRVTFSCFDCPRQRDRAWIAKALAAERVPVDLGYSHLGRHPKPSQPVYLG